MADVNADLTSTQGDQPTATVSDPDTPTVVVIVGVGLTHTQPDVGFDYLTPSLHTLGYLIVTPDVSTTQQDQTTQETPTAITALLAVTQQDIVARRSTVHDYRLDPISSGTDCPCCNTDFVSCFDVNGCFMPKRMKATWRAYAPGDLANCFPGFNAASYPFGPYNVCSGMPTFVGVFSAVVGAFGPSWSIQLLSPVSGGSIAYGLNVIVRCNPLGSHCHDGAYDDPCGLNGIRLDGTSWCGTFGGCTVPVGYLCYYTVDEFDCGPPFYARIVFFAAFCLSTLELEEYLGP